MKNYDIIVIGSGPSVASFLGSVQPQDKSILVVDGGPFGGICPNEGCEPKIFLEGTVKTVLTAKKLLGNGISRPAKLDWSALIKAKKRFIDSFPEDVKKSYRAMGADILQGMANFVDNHTIQVDDQRFHGDKIVIATGQKPRQLNLPGSDNFLTSTDVFNLEELPKKIAIIGSGYIGMEFATIFLAAGAEVSIITQTKRPLEQFYSEHVDVLAKELERNGAKFYFEQGVQEFTDNHLKTQQGLDLPVDMVLNATGRVPTIDGLALNNTDIEYNSRGITTNKHLETSVLGVYAMGDIVDKKVPKLTSTAQFEGEYLGKFINNSELRTIDYPIISSVAFTFPQISMAGIDVNTAKNDAKYKVENYDLAKMAPENFFYLGTADYEAKLTLVFDENDRLVGISEVSQTAVDDVNNFVSIMGFGIDGQTVRQKLIPNFPSLFYKLKGLIK